jgi:hypothetical protein
MIAQSETRMRLNQSIGFNDNRSERICQRQWTTHRRVVCFDSGAWSHGESDSLDFPTVDPLFEPIDQLLIRMKLKPFFAAAVSFGNSESPPTQAIVEQGDCQPLRIGLWLPGVRRM